MLIRGVSKSLVKASILALSMTVAASGLYGAGNKQIPPSDIPYMIFTLQSPTKYQMPKEIKWLIMYCLKMNQNREDVWRDEYKNIRNNKQALIEWLDEKIGDAVRDETYGYVENYKNACNRGDSKGANYWLEQMGGANEQNRFAWAHNRTEMSWRWHLYITEGW